jgi:hypothetical protein
VGPTGKPLSGGRLRKGDRVARPVAPIPRPGRSRRGGPGPHMRWSVTGRRGASRVPGRAASWEASPPMGTVERRATARTQRSPARRRLGGRPTGLEPAARDGPNGAVRDAPAAVGTMVQDLELGRRELHSIRGTDPGAEPAEYTNVGVDVDHDGDPGAPAEACSGWSARPRAVKPVRAHLIRTGDRGIPSIVRTSSRVSRATLSIG